MTVDIEQIKKKIIYRSNYRGTKEMDKLLGAFTSKYLDQLNGEDLNELIKFLEIDDNNLYNFYNGMKTDIEFEDNKINNLFKNFNVGKLYIDTQGTSNPTQLSKLGREFSQGFPHHFHHLTPQNLSPSHGHFTQNIHKIDTQLLLQVLFHLFGTLPVYP